MLPLKARVEGVVSAPNGLIAGHLTIGLNAMFQAEELPAGVANLDSALGVSDTQTRC